jgi:hypothetical protein
LALLFFLRAMELVELNGLAVFATAGGAFLFDHRCQDGA